MASRSRWLTERRAFWTFVLAFVVASWWIWFDQPGQLAPVGIVMAYGFAVLVFSPPTSGSLQDSPYFLGFTLTLVALGKIFDGVTNVAPGAILPVPDLLGTAVLAVLATVAGLLMRQALVSFGEDLDSGHQGAQQLEFLSKSTQAIIEIRRSVENLVAAPADRADALKAETAEISRAAKASRRHGEALDSLTRAITDAVTPTQKLAATAADIGEKLARLHDPLRAFDARLSTASDQLTLLGQTVGSADQRAGAFAETLDRDTEALKNLRQALDGFSKALAAADDLAKTWASPDSVDR